jgi:hypothetical protein
METGSLICVLFFSGNHLFGAAAEALEPSQKENNFGSYPLASQNNKNIPISGQNYLSIKFNNLILSCLCLWHTYRLNSSP